MTARSRRPAGSTLATWAARRGDLDRAVGEALALGQRRTRAGLDRLGAVGSREVTLLRELAQAEDAYQAAFDARWVGQRGRPFSGAPVSLVSGRSLRVDGGAEPLGAQTPRRVIDALRAEAAALPSRGGIPVVRLVKARQRYDEEAAAGLGSMRRAAAARVRLLTAIADLLATAARDPRALTSSSDREVAAMNRRLVAPAGIGEGVADLADVVPGYGAWSVQCGWYVDLGPQVVLAGGLVASTETALPLVVPAIVDVDRAGIATDSRTALTSLVVRLLALLPPSQLRLEVFDPVQLGRSVAFATTDATIADVLLPGGIATSSRDLHGLLDRVEAHVAQVTTRQLGTAHADLHAFNRQAGDVAEPYRVLLINDFPHGFVRADGSVDRDALAQLGKLVAAGPRCGVYPLVHIADWQPFSNGHPLLPAVIPRLREGGDLADHFVAWPPSAPKAVAVPEVDTRGDDRQRAARVAARGAGALVAGRSHLVWIPPGESQIAPAQVQRVMLDLERRQRDAARVQVSAGAVADLAGRRRAARVARGLQNGPAVADPADPRTWWAGDSLGGVTARVGRAGADSVAEVTLGSDQDNFGMLVGGQPGAGKSVFLHALIGDLTRTYSPDHLQLFLIDIKHGVSFRPYAAGEAPHCRTVGLECDRTFGIAVLRELTAKIASRSRKLKEAGQSDLAGYRRKTGATMPRIVAVIDEFHGLFELDDALGEEAAHLLRVIIKTGRSFGVHVVLATQQLTGAPALPRDALKLLPIRVVFQCPDTDSRLLLADDNPAAASLHRAGHGILNRRNGHKDHNEPFQGVYVDESTEPAALAVRLRALARQRRLRRQVPRVFDTTTQATISAAALASFRRGALPTIPVGLPFGLGEPVGVRLVRATGGNVLVVAPAARALPVLSLTSTLATAGSTSVEVLDLSGATGVACTALEPLAVAARRAGLAMRLIRPGDLETRIGQVRDLVDRRRGDGATAEPARVLILAGLGGAARIAAGTPTAEHLEHVLAEGPSVGVHTVAWLESVRAVQKQWGYGWSDWFGSRVVARLPAADSHAVLDSDQALRLSDLSLLVRGHDDVEPVLTQAYGAISPTDLVPTGPAPTPGGGPR
jgi:hypothetical protein